MVYDVPKTNLWVFFVLTTCILHSFYGINKKCPNKALNLWKVETLVYQKVKGVQFMLLQLSCIDGKNKGWVQCNAHWVFRSKLYLHL
jgi:hypothetical protein